MKYLKLYIIFIFLIFFPGIGTNLNCQKWMVFIFPHCFWGAVSLLFSLATKFQILTNPPPFPPLTMKRLILFLLFYFVGRSDFLSFCTAFDCPSVMVPVFLTMTTTNASKGGGDADHYTTNRSTNDLTNSESTIRWTSAHELNIKIK